MTGSIPTGVLWLSPQVRAIAASVTADVLAVLAFAFIGRVVHHEGVSGAGVLSTVWPFLVGLALGWAALLTLHLHPRARLAAFFPITGTVLFGLLLRAWAQGEPVPASFVVVAVTAVTGFLLGWRSLNLVVRRRRQAAAG